MRVPPTLFPVFAQPVSSRQTNLHPLTGSLRLVLFALVALSVLAARAQSSFPGTAVGSNSSAQAVTVTVAAGGSVASVEYLTLGAPNLDYTSSGGGDTCTGHTFSAGQTCSVSVAFGPKYPGLRNGAVVLLSAGKVVLGTAYLSGIGQGSLAVMIPGTIGIAAGQVGQWTLLNDNQPATMADLYLPSGMAMDGAGDLFIADSNHNRVREVLAAAKGAIPAGDIITVAGDGNAGYNAAATVATTTPLDIPTSVAIDGAGNLYIADTNNNVIRKVNLALNTITTIAGNAQPGYTGDGGAATSAELNSPKGITVDAAGNLYIADTSNNVIREVIDGQISTVVGSVPGTAGFAGDGQAATTAELNAPYAVAFDPSGNMYIPDSANNRIRVVSGGNINTFAGGNNGGYGGDGGAATAAELDSPFGVACDPAGNVYIADARNYVIRKVSSASGKISTVAGNNENGTYGDGKNGYIYGNGQSGEQYSGNGIAQGLPSSGIGGAGIYAPYAITVDASGNLFVAEYFNHIIRKISASQATLFFAPQIWVGQTSPPQVQTVENDGNLSLTFSAVGHDANADEDSTDTTCSTTASVSVDEQCNVGAEFAPTAPGNPRVGNDTLTTNAPDASLDIATVGQSLAQNQVDVTLNSTPNPSNFGQAVTFKVTVAQGPGSTQGVPTGTVSFADTFNGATNPIGTTQTLSAGAATLQLTNLAVGTHVIVATYSGNTYYLGAASNPDSQVVTEQVAVTLVNSSGNNPSVLGANVTFQATVAITGGIAVTNTVSFYDAATLLGTAVANAGGVATYSTTALPLGSNSITATYTDANNVTGTSAPLVQMVKQQTAVALSSSVNPSIFGTAVTFTGTITATGTVAPSGSVVFYDGATSIGAGTLAATGANTAAGTFTISTLGVGAHNITAVYGGDTKDFNGTSPIVVQTVQDATTTTTLSASVNPAIAGKPVVLTARVAASSGGVAPSGKVNFLNGTALLGAGTLNASGTATLTATLGAGTYPLTAVYLGDNNDVTSTSAVLSLSVVKATTSVVLTASATAVTVSTPVMFTATLSGNGGVPTGSVTFMDGTKSLGTAALNAAGIATLTSSALTVGAQSITAVYGGDTNDAGSTSAPLTVTVGAFATQTVLAASASSVSSTQSLTLIATTTSTGGNPVSGTITFSSSSATLGTGTLSGDAATLKVTLAAGSYKITAKFPGDALDAPSTSNTITVTVGQSTDFSVQLAPASLTIPTTKYGLTTINLKSLDGFTDSMALGCSSLPFSVTCNFSSNDVLLSANGTASVQLTVDTNSPLVSGGQAKNEMPLPHGGMLAACVFPGSAVFGFAFWRFRKRHGVLKVLAIVAMLAGSTFLMNGCGGISLSSAKSGSYTIQVTATGEKTGTIHVANLTVQVTQ